jgi:hypothetical protein
MEDPIFVLVGAGASADCSTQKPARPERTPPLVTQLFDERFETVLREYPLAQTAAAEIRKAQAQNDPRTLEQFIAQRYRDGEHPNDRRIFYSLAYYLQHVLWEVSTGYTHYADNYDLLHRALERFEHVSYVTLNYDTLLDQRLEVLGPVNFGRLNAYVSHPRFSLIKLHGSVNWSRPVFTPGLDQSIATHPPELIEWGGDDGQMLLAPTRGDLDSVRFRSTPSPHFFFPALSVPLGADDLISCPDLHLQFLRDKIDMAGAIDLLVIGYSGYDREILKIFGGGLTSVRSMYVVNKDAGAAQDVADRITAGLGKPVPAVRTYRQTFGEFVQSGDIDAFVEWVRTVRG